MMSWLTGLLMCTVAAVSALWTRQLLLRKVRHEMAQIASTMGNQADVHSMRRGYVMAKMLHHLSVVLLFIALVLFIYSMNRAAAISISTLAILYLVARLKQLNYVYLRRSRL